MSGQTVRELAFAAMSSLIVSAVPSEQTGVASGMHTNIRTIGGSVGAALMASIVTSRLGAGGLPKEAGYTIGFAMRAGAPVIAAIAALFIPTQGVRPPSPPRDEPEHAELALLAGGTIFGDKPE